MARPINRLTARFVATAPAGMHADGAGLYLLVTPEGTASWIFRYARAGRKHDMGLGAATLYSLADARQRRDQQRRLLADGLDPIEERRLTRGATPRLWGQAKADFIAAHRGEWKSTPTDPDAPPGKQQLQWEHSLRDYGPDDALPVARLDTDAVLACLRPLWKPTAAGGKVETATRVRGRIERVWDAEKVRGTVTGDNPARWKGHLEHLLPKPRKVQKPGHFEAIAYADLPELMARLLQRDGITRRALRWTILTVARTEETVGLDWSELDFRKGDELWSIPGARMKMGLPHVVPLTADAIACLDGLPRDRPPFALSENAMLNLLQDASPKGFGLTCTTHGMRSAFSDWAHETTAFPKHVVDMALAHKIKDKADAAYRRGDLLAKRWELMEAWARFLLSQV